jgi:hypothetical protein
MSSVRISSERRSSERSLAGEELGQEDLGEDLVGGAWWRRTHVAHEREREVEESCEIRRKKRERGRREVGEMRK